MKANIRKGLSAFFAGVVLIAGFHVPVRAEGEIQGSPVLYVDFEGNVEDHSGNENHGTVHGDVTYVDGVKGKAIHIVNKESGSQSKPAEQYVSFGNGVKFGSDDFALSFWYKSDNGVSNGGALLSNKNFDSGANPGFNIGDFDTGLRVNFTAEGSSRRDVYNFAPIDGVWHHVAVNFDRDGSIITYLDGEEAGSTDISKDAGKTIDVAEFVLGADGYGKNSLNDAYVDELVVYDRLMSEDEIIDASSIDEVDETEILHLTFNDETANDVSGNENHGTVHNVEYTDGVEGKALHIENKNGSSSKEVDSYVDFGQSSASWLGSDDYTVSLWYKSNAGDEDGGTIISNKDYDSGANPGFALGSFSTQVRSNFAIGGTRIDQYEIMALDGDWHHVAVSYDRDGMMTSYLDGVKVGEKNIAQLAGKSIDSGNIMIGADINKCYGLLDSYLDEVHIFKSVKSADEIKKMYDAFTSTDEPKDDLLLYAALDGNAQDSGLNGNHGKIKGAPSFVKGVKGQAIHIVNGEDVGSSSVPANQYVDFGKKIKLGSDDFALSFWYKSDNGVSNGGAMISNKNFDSGANPGFNIGDFDTGLRVNFAVSGGSRKDVYNFAPIDGVWHHVVVNFDRDGSIATYLDGKEAGSTDISKDAGKTIDVANFVIGADGMGENGLNDAYLDEVKVFARCISTDEITSDYEETYLSYVVSDARSFYEEALKNSKYDKAKLELLLVEIEKGEAILEAEDYSELDVVVEDIRNALENAKEGVEGVVEGQMLYVSFDEENTQDDSGRGNHGESTGNVTYVDGVEGKAVHIVNENGSTMDKAQSYINFGQPEDLKFSTEDFAIAFWYKSVDGGGKEAAIISNKDWSTGSNEGFNIGNFGDSIRVNYTAQGHGRDDIYSLTANDDEWHYIVVNFDRDDKISAYIDGNFENSVDISDTYGKSIDATDFVIGADGNKTQGINNAYLDEVRVMKRLMSEVEIEENYLPFKLDMKINEYEEALNKAKEEGYDENKIAEFEKVLNEVKEESEGADKTTMRQMIRKLTNAFDRFQTTKTPIISFQVLADVHIDGSDDKNKSRKALIDALEDIAVLDPTSSVVLYPGDFTDSGSESQYQSFYNIIEEYNFTEAMIALGNHDVRWLCSSADRNEPSLTNGTCKYGTSPWKERYMKYNLPYMGEDADEDTVYFDRWINGYHFITLNTENDLKDQAYLSKEQLAWLKETLAENASIDKPIFIQIHQAFKGAGDHEELDWIGAQEEELKEILRDYPQSVIFTGHIHNGIDLAKVHKEDFGHVVDMPAFKYQSYGDKRAQIGYQIDVFENEIEVRPRDFKNDVWLSDYNAVIELEKEPVDKSELNKAIEEAEATLEATDIDNYTEASVEALESALDTAKALTDNATQEEVNEATKALTDAMTGLELKKADYTVLNDILEKAEALVKENYVDFSEVTKALETAKTLPEDLKITEQKQIDEVVSAIKNAMNNLELKKADYTKVDEAIKKAETKLEEGIYTEASVKVVEDAINAVVRDLDITKQGEVDAMVKAIEEAIANLEEKPEEPTDPDKPTIPEEDNKPGEEGEGPDSGDGTNVGGLLTLLGLAGIAIAYETRKRVK